MDGRVFASDPDTGEVAHSWDLHNISGPRGWHRGLVLLRDGFLVGSTVLRGDAISWSSWRFDPSESRTGVTFVPYSPSEGCKGGPCSVSFLTDRHAKVFSLLRQPLAATYRIDRVQCKSSGAASPVSTDVYLIQSNKIILV